MWSADGVRSSCVKIGGHLTRGLAREFPPHNLTRPRILTHTFSCRRDASFARPDGHAACIKARRRDSRFIRTPVSQDFHFIPHVSTESPVGCPRHGHWDDPETLGALCAVHRNQNPWFSSAGSGIHLVCLHP